MHSTKWKLTNRDLSEGYLTVTEDELKRILEEVIREKVLKGLPIPVDEKICQTLVEYLAPLDVGAGDHKGPAEGGPGGSGRRSVSALHQEDARPRSPKA